jgi:predicted nucleic acid-binding protein
MVVCDSGPLIYLSRIGQLQLLRKLFGSVFVPGSVYREVVEEAKALRKPGVSSIQDAIKEGWIRVVRLEASDMDLVKKLAADESIEVEDAEVVYLAKKHSTGLVTNDKWLVKIAISFQIQAFWTTSLLLLAVKKKILSRDQGRELIRKLVLSGLHLRVDVYEGILSALEELS